MQQMPNDIAVATSFDRGDTSDHFANFTPAYGSFTCQSWLRPELHNFAKEVDKHGIPYHYEEVAYVNSPALRAQPPSCRLAVVEEFSSTKVVGDSTTVMFEIDSEALLVSCSVEIQCYRNQELYDTIKLSMEAGSEIPNTHVLNLRQLEEGQHDIYFSASTESADVHHEKFSFRVTPKQPSRSLSKQSGRFVASREAVDVHALTNKMMKEGMFNSRGSCGGSTCIGSTSVSSYDPANTSEEE
jgi:hypothetical protein